MIVGTVFGKLRRRRRGVVVRMQSAACIMRMMVRTWRRMIVIVRGTRVTRTGAREGEHNGKRQGDQSVKRHARAI